MPRQSLPAKRPSLLKRKRTPSLDEGCEVGNLRWRVKDDVSPLEKNCATPECSETLLSPESIASSHDASPEPSTSGLLSLMDIQDDSDQELHTSHFMPSVTDRLLPLPISSWADPKEVWEQMRSKDALTKTRRDPDMFSRHPSLTPRMRSILLDWLIEVCDVYKLHRETYHLTMNYIDRYLSNQMDIPKQQLQLIGITSLFIASKIEEIYPPKLTEFAYVTDGACTEAEILDKEMAILKNLDWKLNTRTANSWLSVYFQLCSDCHQKNYGKNDENVCNDFLIPNFSGLNFIQAAKLVDFCTLDEGCLRFSYSVIAASALYIVYDREMALRASGMKWSEIRTCVEWMSPFAETLREEGIIQSTWNDPEACDIVGEVHNIQKHTVEVKVLELAQQRLLDSQLETISPGSAILTPPASSKKSKLLKDTSNFT